MSRALLYPIPDWPALSVACTKLSEQLVSPVHSQNVVDTTDTDTFAKESTFCLRVLAQLNAFVHCSNDARLPWLRVDPR